MTERSLLHVARVLEVFEHEPGQKKLVVGQGGATHLLDAPAAELVVGDIIRLRQTAQGFMFVGKLGSSAPGAWQGEHDGLRWRRRLPDGSSRLSLLHQRHAMRRAMQGVLDRDGFIEIEAPLLVHGTTPDPSIPSFAIGDRYLVTSTEYQIKRMIAGGFERAYSFTKNFREGDASPLHNPEFTMLEWARVGVDLSAIETDIENMTLAACRVLAVESVISYGAHRIDLTPPWKRLSIAEALREYLNVELPDFSLATIQRAAELAGVAVRSEWREDRFLIFTLLLDRLQQHLGFERPVFLREWPSFLTSSAQERPDGETAERSELFIAGVEIGDGFPSLTDPARQAETFARQLERRAFDKTPKVDLDGRYLEALRLGLPPGAGMAVGFDRLCMVLLGQTDIRNVLAFAWDEV